jgi:hypothetical protein
MKPHQTTEISKKKRGQIRSMMSRERVMISPKGKELFSKVFSGHLPPGSK